MPASPARAVSKLASLTKSSMGSGIGLLIQAYRCYVAGGHGVKVERQGITPDPAIEGRWFEQAGWQGDISEVILCKVIL